MNWEYWLALAVVAGAVGAVFYFSTRPEKKDNKPARGREPSFVSRRANAEDDGSTANSDSASAQAGVSGESAKNNPAGGREATMRDLIREINPNPTPRPRPQGTLEMENFTPPELPSPDENLLPLDMCYAAWFYGEKEVNCAAAETLLEAMRPKKTKNSYQLGFDESAQQWRLASQLPSRYWIAAVPLADRGGPIDKDDIRRMEDAGRAFAQKHKMRPMFPAANAALEDAARIDNFCATVDMFIELRLSGDGQSSSRVEEVMRLAGLTKDGSSYVRRANSEEWFCGRVMPPASSGARQTIVFEMDAPNISAPPRAFEDMLRVVRRCAHMLEMDLTDPKGAPVDNERAAAMSRQLSLLASQMRDFGAEPGGAIARLIFS